ncbi:MAG: chorismate synthase [Bacteroidetes bacterium GWF2_49_14]|nr:MAG: chorismate synthase [Bacteroidetes bacterium GWF2_49_14]HBB93250.1 chorismate synthase [Bacteroidales bacterium]
MNSFGNQFRVSIFGESHGPVVGITIDGCPAGIPLGADDFISDIKRRQPGATGTTPRVESDEPRILSGWFNGFTTGAPLTIMFENQNIKSGDYDHLKIQPRPGHADWVAMQKFNGFNDHRGGGHFSGRLTLAIVAAGVVAKKVIPKAGIRAVLIEAGGLTDIPSAIRKAEEDNDSIGGIVECRVTGLPVGLGEPFFDSVESLLAHAVFAIPAIKGIEFGSGFAAGRMKGSEHNDRIIAADGTTDTNYAGGINGGLTNGNELVFRVAVKPTSSTSKPQQTLNLKSGKVEELVIGGRHDRCIALRVPVVVEAMTAVVLAGIWGRL